MVTEIIGAIFVFGGFAWAAGAFLYSGMAESREAYGSLWPMVFGIPSILLGIALICV